MPAASLREATTAITYSNGATTSPSVETVREHDGEVLSWEKTVYDDLGRVSSEQVRRPTGETSFTISERRT
ncbi:MAG: hypothetical protein GY722_10600, partial [bacterium]|nr:hypothetical protein [bacterium]